MDFIVIFFGFGLGFKTLDLDRILINVNPLNSGAQWCEWTIK